ncbi:hypothetical protein BAUCODRAFT_125515 [Baudoinia panamericana UAMH 10762]|uniref:Uncharacterized protein n=1 Tax=Baudoinia panamericana (strain UAMH 10762) TaxID=717646 RepID=M2N3T6_BAUPA|nr:uncharacterized protein BAUCODRAFT_125515 [Baudoinia panamericana UAMH 10762]EMC93679.1 hypothetical protein BAUCODRAFT_125515 [Baudoinia panamericana UAMH 10762]
MCALYPRTTPSRWNCLPARKQWLHTGQTDVLSSVRIPGSDGPSSSSTSSKFVSVSAGRRFVTLVSTAPPNATTQPSLYLDLPW